MVRDPFPFLEAAPLCIHCKGSGFDIVRDLPCSCLRDIREDDIRTEHYLPRPILTDDQKATLERHIRGELMKARAPFFASTAATIARAVAMANLPPDVPTLARFAKVSENVAARVMDRVRAAVQTKKKESVNDW